MLNNIDAEEDGAEDHVGPSLDDPSITAPIFPFISSDLGTSNYIISSLPPSDPGISSQSSGSTRPPPSSSLLPTIHPHPSQHNISMGSVTTGSETSSSQLQKRKHDVRSMSEIQLPSSKRASKSKTNGLNLVIISNTLNSTLNHMADLMERMLDVTTAPSSLSTTSVTPSSIIPSSLESQALPVPSHPLSASASSTEILDQAIRIISGNDGSLTDDELLAACLFFTSASEDAIRTTHTFIAFGNNNQSVKYRFLLHQLNTACLLPGKGKARAVEDGDDLSMVY